MAFFERSEADGFMVVTPDEYARQAVDVIGMPGLSAGCAQHAILVRYSLFLH